jgi:hypothetical protein
MPVFKNASCCHQMAAWALAVTSSGSSVGDHSMPYGGICPGNSECEDFSGEKKIVIAQILENAPERSFSQFAKKLFLFGEWAHPCHTEGPGYFIACRRMENLVGLGASKLPVNLP